MYIHMHVYTLYIYVYIDVYIYIYTIYTQVYEIPRPGWWGSILPSGARSDRGLVLVAVRASQGRALEYAPGCGNRELFHIYLENEWDDFHVHNE